MKKTIGEGYIILILLFCGLLVMLFGRKVDKNNIIKKFEQNIEMFNESVGELIEENIYFNKENLRWGKGKIIIEIHERLENGTVNIIQVKEEEYDKYQKTINLIEKLKIENISKTKDNISFQFNTMVGLNQSIIRLKNEKDYIGNGYKIVYKEEIQNDWYYIETK